MVNPPVPDYARELRLAPAPFVQQHGEPAGFAVRERVSAPARAGIAQAKQDAPATGQGAYEEARIGLRLALCLGARLGVARYRRRHHRAGARQVADELLEVGRREGAGQVEARRARAGIRFDRERHYSASSGTFNVVPFTTIPPRSPGTTLP